MYAFVIGRHCRAETGDFQLWCVVLPLSLLSVAALGIVDFMTGSQTAFSVFYLGPILFITWRGSWRAGLVVSVAGALACLVAEVLKETGNAPSLIPFWSAAIKLLFFASITAMFSILRATLGFIRELTKTDPLTGRPISSKRKKSSTRSASCGDQVFSSSSKESGSPIP